MEIDERNRGAHRVAPLHFPRRSIFCWCVPEWTPLSAGIQYWILWCLLILVVLPFPRLAVSMTDPEIDRLISQIEARYGKMRGLAADFEQTYSGPGVREKREHGRVFLKRPGLMRWEYEPKPGKLFIVNDREVWFYSPADREATQANTTKISDTRLPFLFLLGQKNLRRQFREIAFCCR